MLYISLYSLFFYRNHLIILQNIKNKTRKTTFIHRKKNDDHSAMTLSNVRSIKYKLFFFHCRF
jgi:hypothetical protein